ncbi:hypothetical protein GSI_09315 [Ganoderma sinense ZZ0214-1]|uniref:DUF6697 domain-containing protein n=1 Tax=Ganoderma sinense ZZ0214-1 TaxID=1077348 RepID=A0A2G8S690_9APHY|nr:hypothetical protein GSI_09315 [Ganoderma sinense ZZ0214-1]
MLNPSDDPRKLEITLRHYEEGYTSQALTTAKLQAEIVHLKANIDYLEQCLAEERAQHKSESVSAEFCSTSTFSVVEPLTCELWTTHRGDHQPAMINGPGALALNTPPVSDRGSLTQPVALEDKAQSSDIVDAPLPERPRNAVVTYPRKRTIAPDRDQSHHRSPPPEEKAGPSHSRKKAKSVVHVLIPPLSEDKRRAFSRAPLAIYEDETYRASSSRAARTKRERDDSIQPVQTTGREARHLRSRSRELSYVDPPVPRRASNGGRRKSAAPAESSSSVHPSSQLLLSTNHRQIGDNSKQQDVQRVLRPLPRRSAYLRSAAAPVPANSGMRTSADAVDRLCDIPSLDIKVSDKSLLDKTASRAQLSAVLGGASRRTCVTVNDRHLLYPSHEFQPWRPSKPGGPGLLLYPIPEQAWQGDVQTVFVALYTAKYRYVGEYRLTQDEPLSPDEFNALPLATKQKWATHITQTLQYKEIRVRIATRRDKAREATMQEVMTVANDIKNVFRGTVTADDVLRAYESGDERMHVWRMACVRFDESFLRDLVGNL